MTRNDLSRLASRAGLFLSTLFVLTASAFGSVRIGYNMGLPFQFALDGSENSYTVASMTNLSGVSGLFVTKLSSAGKIVFSDRIGYGAAATPFAFFLDSAGDTYTISSLTALNGVAGLYVTKINSSGAVTYTTRLGTAATSLPFAAGLDSSGNIHIVSNMTSLAGVSGLFSIKLNLSGSVQFSDRLGTSPATSPFVSMLDNSGSAYTLASMTALSGVSGLYLTKVNSTGTTVYSDQLGTKPTAGTFGGAVDLSSNAFTIANATSLNGVSGLYFVKTNATGTSVYSERLGYNPAGAPFWADVDASDNAFTVSSLTSVGGVSGLYFSKLSSSGTLVYNGRLGYNAATSPFAATLDSGENLCSVANMTALNGVAGLYFSKLSATGSSLYSERIGSNPASAPFDARLDGSGNGYALASMTGTNGEAGFYVTKLNSNGGVVYADRIGSNAVSAPFADVLDAAQNVYTVANMTGLNSTSGLYFTKLNSTGTVIYNFRLGITPAASPFAYVVDGSGDAYSMVNMTNLSGVAGLYLNKTNPSGSLVYSERLGTNPATTAAYYVDASGNALSVVSMTATSGVTGLFVSKLNSSGGTVY